MEKEEILAVLGVALGLPTLVQISPIKINPWSWLRKLVKRGWAGFCKSLNAPMLAAMEKMQTEQSAAIRRVQENLLETKKALDHHIAEDDEREANKIRSDILRFNNELMRGIGHTEEEFVEILAKIDWYHDYCKDHETYKNSRAVHAIANIERVYDVRLEKHDFLS